MDSADFRGADPYRYGVDQATHVWFVVDKAAFPPCDVVARAKPGKAGGGRKKSKDAGQGGGARGSRFSQKMAKPSLSRRKSGSGGGRKASLQRANTCKARIHHAK